MPEQQVYGLLPLLMCREVIREDGRPTGKVLRFAANGKGMGGLFCLGFLFVL